MTATDHTLGERPDDELSAAPDDEPSAPTFDDLQNDEPDPVDPARSTPA